MIKPKERVRVVRASGEQVIKKLELLKDFLAQPAPLGVNIKDWIGARTTLYELQDLILGTKSFDKPRRRP